MLQIKSNRSVQNQIMRPVTVILVLIFALFAVIGIGLFQGNIARGLQQDNQNALAIRANQINDR